MRFINGANRTIVVTLCFLLVFTPMGRATEPGNRETLNDWCLELINAPSDLTPGTNPVKIALIDSGVRADNPYLPPGSIAPGQNYVFGGTVTNDLIGHGTQTAGIIVGAASDRQRLSGLCNRATIVPLVGVTRYASGVPARADLPTFGKAIRDAIDTYGCGIINLSIGVSSDDPDLRAAVAYAEEHGVIVVAAVGNTNLSAPDELFYPAAYPTVIGVGAVGRDSLAAASSQRNDSVMVVAPGDRVYSLAPDPTVGFEPVSGTSYSAAYVSGFAALLRSYNPDLTPAEFRQLLQTTARDLGPTGYDTTYGYGLIDVSHGLELQGQLRVAFTDVAGWYAGYVASLAARGIVTGRSATAFAPLDSITRAEFATILARISGDALPGGSPAFADIDPGSWFVPYVQWAASAGVATGDGGRFHPDEVISRQDMALMVVRFAESRLKEPLLVADATFADRDLIADYARSAVGKLQRAGILCGDGADHFSPRAPLRRCDAAKVAALLLRILEGQ